MYPASKLTNLLSNTESSRNLRVQHKHKSSSNSSECVGTSSLEQSRGSLLLDNLSKAVSSSLVDPFLLGLLGLHLETTTDSVKGVRGVSGTNGRELSAGELGSSTQDAVLRLLVGVVSREGIKETKVDSTVRDDTNDGNSDTVVEGYDSTRSDGLLKTVSKTVELGLSTSNIGGETSTGVIEGVDNHQRSSSGKTSRSHVDGEELGELGVLVGLGEQSLDGILEGEVEGLGGEITNDVGQVTTPESLDTLLAGNTGEAVHDTSVTSDLSADNLRVSILGLDQKLDTLNGGCAGLSDGSRDTTGQKVDKEIAHCCCCT
mmetsp:Transcript_8005/g.11891  ORF Transcript_8005/g.11891 Transcript_8005/m.11891 type:complete len:317 (-) Transcript_8005:61-1011(-)